MELEFDLTALSERVDAVMRGLARLEDRVEHLEHDMEVVNLNMEQMSLEFRRHDKKISDAEGAMQTLSLGVDSHTHHLSSIQVELDSLSEDVGKIRVVPVPPPTTFDASHYERTVIGDWRIPDD